MPEEATTVNNGVNVQALLDAKEALTDAPEAALFKWRASCEWLNGTHSKSSVEGYYGLGEEHKHRSEFNVESDHPLVFAAEDNAATPVEIVPRRPGRLPDGRRRCCCTEPRNSIEFRQSDA